MKTKTMYLVSMVETISNGNLYVNGGTMGKTPLFVFDKKKEATEFTKKNQAKFAKKYPNFEYFEIDNIKKVSDD